MLYSQLIRKLHKRLRQVLAILARVIASSAQRLRILLFCFRRIVADIGNLPRHGKDSSTESAQGSCAVLSPSSQVNSSSPLHYGQAQSVTAVRSNQDASSPSMPSPTGMIISPAAPTQTSLNMASVNFEPICARNKIRYERRSVADRRARYPVIENFKREFPNKSCPWLNNTSEWQPYVHPEGALYLYNGCRGAFTEANIGETTFRWVDECMDAVYKKSTIPQSDDIELVLQVSLALDANPLCQYYFVDHANRTLFWVWDVQETEDFLYGLQGTSDPSHVGYALESEYWTHCERYPNHKQDRVKLIKELRELVMYSRAEIITSDNSLSPFNADELSSILDLISHLEVNAEDEDSPHSTCIVARFMHYFSKSKFFNFCGLPCARLDADKSVYKETPGSAHPLTSKLSMVFDAFLFWSPQAHHNDLRRVWVDECIIEPRWSDFSRNLMTEWTGITIYTTVMLAVDVSFLAVPNVNVQQAQSVGVIATYISTVFITGSLITSLLLARQTQRYGPESAERAAQLLLKMTGTFFGTKGLSTVHSLPYAMLLWGMIFFAVAFLYNIFKATTTAMLGSVISGTVVVTMSILWFIWAAREVHIFKAMAKYVKSFTKLRREPVEPRSRTEP